jgi:superfamily II DNA or RNA helicase
MLCNHSVQHLHLRTEYNNKTTDLDTDLDHYTKNLAAIAPRPYQEKLIRDILKAFTTHRRVVLQLATGGGKTIVFCLLALEFLKQGEGVLILAHRQELINQAHEKVEAISGLPAGKIQAGKAINWDYDIQVASVQTLTRRKAFPEAALVIVDECHHASAKSYTRIMEAYPNAYILGVSATPCRTDGQSLKRHFDHLITGPTVGDLIQQNYLSKYKLYAAAKKIDTTGVKTKRGDFDLTELAEAVDDSIVCGDVIKTWQEYAKGTQTIVFNVDIDHSIKIAEAFNQEGVSAAHIDGTTPKGERDRLITAFKNKEITVLSNCAIFTEGFDCPRIETVVVVRPTKSLILWLQIIGRALRVIEGKDYARIIDHTDNWKNLGLPDDEFEWSLEPKSLKKGAAFAQECPKCHHIFRPLPHEIKEPHRTALGANGKLAELFKLQCPSCLESFEVQFGEGDGGGGEPKILSKDESVQVEEINLDTQDWAIALFEELKSDQEATRKKQGWIYYRLKDSGRSHEFTLGDWRYFAKRLNYKQGWAYYKYQEAQASNNQPTKKTSIFDAIEGGEANG